MKSGKQRRKEIKEKRLHKAKEMQALDTTIKVEPLPVGAVAANVELLAKHNNSYGLPQYYVDQSYICRDCGSKEIWTAKQQKWWYEVVLGNINAIAVRCRSCRRKKRLEKNEQLSHMAEMAERKPHPNEEFFKKRH